MGGVQDVLALALLLGLFLIVPSHASAQAVTGTLLGNVTDTTGAAVPGTTVTARETQTNVSRTTTTNETGFYIFSSLQNGTYAVEAELQGFKKVLREGVASRSTPPSASISSSRSAS